MTVETEVAALTSAVNLLTSTVNVSKATLDASVAAAEAAYDSFDDRYLGAKVSAPSLDNDGGSLLTGALYFNSTENAMYVYTGASWVITTNYNNVTAPYTLAQTLNTNGNNVTFGVNGKAIFGAGSDLQIYHDGAHSYIKDVGAGDLRIWADSPNIATASGNKIFYGNNGSAELYTSGGTLRLATTATGIDVTGTATMDGLSVDGASSGTLNNVNFLNTNAGATATATRIGLGITNSAGAAYTYIEANEGGVDSYPHLNFYTGSSATKRLEIADNGDVSLYEDTGTTAKLTWSASNESLGLNNINPSATYSVDAAKGIRVSAAAPNFTLQETDAANQTWLMASYAGSFAIRDTTVSGTAYPLQIEAATPSNTLYLDSSGNVGIGTALPTNGKLVIEESGTSVGSTIRLIGTNTSGSASQVSHITSYQPAGGTAEASALDFKVRGTDPYATPSTVMTLLGGGNVGIGTSSPSSLLNVSKNQAADTAIEVSNLGSAGAATTASFIVSETAGIPKGWFRRYRDGSARTSIGYDGSFTIESTAGAERMRIDSSGNLLVGHTSAEGDSSGTTLYQNGQTVHKADGAYALELVRSTSDGEIVRFRKDGTAVGSIGTVGGVLTIGNGDTGLLFSGSGDYITPRNPTTQAGRDAAINLGTGSDRFKDLYLSGGVYLGGTGAANLLDDYEKGNWTPIFNNFSATGTTTNAGLYVKVGNLVYVELNLDLSSPSYTGGGSGTYITGLPFSIAGQFVVSVGASNLLNTATFIDNNGGGGNLFFKNSTFTTAGIGSVGFMNSSGRLRFTATYYTTA